MLKIGWDLLFTAINIVMWYIIIKLFLFKPVNNILEKRRETINGKFNEAESAKQDAYALKAKYEEEVMKNEELIEEQKKMKLTSAISGNPDHNRLMKSHINRLIKEIDVCIAELRNSGL